MQRAQKQLLKEIKAETGLEEEPDSNMLEQQKRKKPEAPPAKRDSLGATAMLPHDEQARKTRRLNHQPVS
jgi:hypothetical protein